MKFKGSLFTGVICLVLGGTALMIADDKYDETFETMAKKSFVQKEYVLEETLDSNFSLDLDLITQGLEILPSTDGKLKLDYYQKKDIEWNFEYKDNQLTIKENKNKKWFFSFVLNIIEKKTILYLPIDTFQNFKVEITNGILESNSMNLNLKNANFDVTNGKIDVKNITANEFTTHVTNGSIKHDAIKSKSITSSVTNGEITLVGCEADTYRLKVTNGDIKGTIFGERTEYEVDCSVTNGKVYSPSQNHITSKKIFFAKVTNGKIDVKFITK